MKWFQNNQLFQKYKGLKNPRSGIAFNQSNDDSIEFQVSSDENNEFYYVYLFKFIDL